eukprot:11302-Heterococcus_DN1.PRE.11
MLYCAGSQLISIRPLYTPLINNRCAQGCHFAVVQRLLQHEPTLAARRNEHGDTALMMACVSKAEVGSLDTIKALAEADPSTVKLLNRGCYSAMHLAIRRGAGRALQEVEFLLKAGAEVNTRNIRGE